jgi:hypothetical protein
VLSLVGGTALNLSVSWQAVPRSRLWCPVCQTERVDLGIRNYNHNIIIVRKYEILQGNIRGVTVIRERVVVIEAMPVKPEAN